MLNPGLTNRISETGGIVIPTSDYISVAYPTGDTEVYTFKLGGAGGATVSTITVVYTDSTKVDLSTVTQT